MGALPGNVAVVWRPDRVAVLVDEPADYASPLELATPPLTSLDGREDGNVQAESAERARNVVVP